MKNLKLLFFVALFYICAIGNAQTPAPKGTYYPNATKSDTLSSNTRVPVFNENNILNKYVSIDSLSNYIVSEVGETVVVENEYANMTTMYADQANQTDSFIQYVEDASLHPDIASGAAYFEYLGTTNGNNTDYRVLSESEYGYVTLSGNQTITGRKIFQTTGTGYAALFQTLGLGSALVASTNGFGSAAFLQSTSAAQSLRLQSTGVGKLLTFENESVQTGYVDKNANIKANSINIGGNGNNVMLDNGSVTPLSSLLTTPATVSEINTGTDNTKMVTPLGLAGSDYFTKTQNDTYYKPIGYVPAWTEITGKPTTTSYFTNNGADNTSTYVEHDEISGLVLEPPFLKELVPDTYLPSTTGNFILRGSYFTPSMSVVVEGHTINYKTFISSNEVIVNLTTSATEGLYDVTLNNGISVTYNDQLQVVNGTVYEPYSMVWEAITGGLDVTDNGSAKIVVFNSTSTGRWTQEFDYTKDFSVKLKIKKSPLALPSIIGAIDYEFAKLTNVSDNSEQFLVSVRRDGTTQLRLKTKSDTDSYAYSTPSIGNAGDTVNENFDVLASETIEFRYISGIMYFYYNGLKRTFTDVLYENLKLSINISRFDVIEIKYIDLDDTSGGYVDPDKLISQFENDANYLQDAPSNGNEYVRKDGDWQVATGGGGGSGHTIQDNGVSKTARTNLNFKNFVVDDNAGNNSTDITAVVAGAPLTYNYTAVGAETSINTGVSIASNYQTEIYYGNAVLSPTIDYTLSYGATTTINFTFPLEAGYPIRVVYNSSSAPNAITDTDDVPEGTTNLYADSNATNQGNTFNGANQLVKLDGTGKLPAIDGSNLTNLPSSGDMLKSENLSGLANYTTARSNLGLVIGTNVLAPNGSAAGLTGFPTLNQNTTGSAATLTTPRTINGTSFNGSANITTTNWGTSRNLSIGGTSKAVTGGANVTWSQSEIGVNKSTIDALGINATAVGGVTISGTPTIGQVPVATSGTTATWQTPSGGGVSDGDKGDIVVSGSGATWNLDTSGVSAGSYTNANITVDAKGRITVASNGAGASIPSPITTINQYTTQAGLPTVTGTETDIYAYVTNDATRNNNGLYAIVQGQWKLIYAWDYAFIPIKRIAINWADTSSPDWVTGSTINSSGAIEVSAGKSVSNYIPVRIGDKLIRNIGWGNWAMYDSSLTLIPTTDPCYNGTNGGFFSSKSVNITHDYVKYIRWSFDTSDVGVDGQIVKAYDHVSGNAPTGWSLSHNYERDNLKYNYGQDGVISEKETNQLFNFRKAIYYEGRNEDGAANTSTVSTDFIKIKAGLPYSTSTGISAISFWDINKAFISGTSASWAIAPVSAVYMKIRIGQSDDFKNISIVQSIKPDAIKYREFIEETAINPISVCLIGDSIATEDDGLATSSAYATLMREALGIETFHNVSVSGKSVRDFQTNLNGGRYAMPVADMYIVALGTNDFAYNRAIGTVSDNAAADTFMGGLQDIIEGVTALNANAKIVFFTPIPRITQNNVNATGNKLNDYRNAVIKKAISADINYLDLFEIGLNPFNANILSSFFISSDGTHPNNSGHKLYAYPEVVKFMQKELKR